MIKPKRLKNGDKIAVVSLSWGVLGYFYGPSVMCEFSKYVKMFDYTVEAVKAVLFGNTEGL